MILLLIGRKDLVIKKASDIVNNTSFVLHNNLPEQEKISDTFVYYKKEYEKCIKDDNNVIFLNHHIASEENYILDRDEIYPKWREFEEKMRKNIVVIYFENSLPLNYDLEFIRSKLSRLNWIIASEESDIHNIIDNINNFSEELRIKKI